MMGKTDGDSYTLDDMFVSGAAQREGEGREEERMRSKAIGESRRLAVSMEKCQHCFSSQELQKHLIVAIGSKVRGNIGDWAREFVLKSLASSVTCESILIMDVLFKLFNKQTCKSLTGYDQDF